MRIAKSASEVLVFFAACVGTLWAQSPPGPVTPPPGQPVQQPPPSAQLKLRVDLVNTPVIVSDSKGNMINNLDPGDFRITDNGVEQKISHFDMGGDPLSLVILAETSSRVAALLPEIRKTGILFTQTMMAADGEAAVVAFNDAVDKLQDFTKNADAIEKTIGTLQAGTDGSKLYDAMAVGVEMLTGRPQPSADKPGRRRVMVVLSDSLDSGSGMKFGQVLRSAQLANVTIYSVGLSATRAQLQSEPKHSQPRPSAPPGTFPLPPQPGVIQTPTTEAQRMGNIDLMALAVWAVQHVNEQVRGNPMEVAAAATGGTHVSTYKDRSIENAIDEIGGELHSQYSISYAPTDGNILGYHEIKVQVNRKGLRVRARPGYYVALPEGSS